MRILVTGGAGFIGSHLCERLLGAGHEVYVLDNLSTGTRANVPAGAKLIVADVAQLASRINIPRVDRIYNLACPASPVHYRYEPLATIDTCVYGTRGVLDFARICRARVLQASTSEVYGDPKVHPQTEDYWGNVNTLGPRACYDEGKRMAEALIAEYQREFAVEARIARIFNTYGPRMQPDDGRVVSNFICQALRGLPLTVYGDGTQTRSFCYVDDMVDGLITLMESDYTKPVNLGNPEECGVWNLALLISAMTKSDVPPVMKELPEDDPHRRRPDISSAMALGWEPKVSLDDGLARTVRYFSELIDNHKAIA